MKNKIFIIFLTLIMLFAFSLPVFAWSSNDWWSNIAPDEVVSGSPNAAVASHQQYIMVYNTIDNLYYKLVNTGTAYTVDFYIVSNTGSVTMKNNNSSTFNVYKYESEQWIQILTETSAKNHIQYNLSDCLFVNGTANINIDDVLLEYDFESGKLSAGGVEIDPEHGGGGSDLDGEDINNSGLLSGLTDFIETLFSPILSIFDFIITILEKLGQLLLSLVNLILAIPTFLEGLVSLFTPEGAIMKTINNFFTNNTYANSIGVMLIALLGYGIFRSGKSFIKDGTDWS